MSGGVKLCPTKKDQNSALGATCRLESDVLVLVKIFEILAPIAQQLSTIQPKMWTILPNLKGIL